MATATHASSSTLISTDHVDAADYATFERNGFVRLRQIFTPEAVDHIRTCAEEKIEEQAAGYKPDEMRIAYRLHQMPLMQGILSDPALAGLLTGLTQCGLVPTESQAFELTKDRGAVPWHFGYISYGYIRAEDMAFTLWVPLGDIDAETGGGMAYVPEHIISARHGYDLGTMLAPEILAGDDPTDLLDAFDAAHQAMVPFFEKHCVEDDFQVGDALLFNKHVWHRSSPWLKEDSARRLGIAMRFVADTARVDRVRWQAEFQFGGGIATGQRRAVMAGNEDRYTRFADIGDGELVTSSADCRFVL